MILGKDRQNDNSKTRIFYSVKGDIVGIGKKGKEFFKMSTNLSEDVRSFYVEDTSIWTAGDYIFNRFVDGKDSVRVLASLSLSTHLPTYPPTHNNNRDITTAQIRLEVLQ